MTGLSPQESILQYFERHKSQNTVPSIKDAVAVFNAHNPEFIPYYSKWSDIFIQHFGLQAARSIEGIDDFISFYMYELVKNGGSGGEPTRTAIAVRELSKENTYVVLPRGDHHKTLSTSIPLKDLYRNNFEVIFNTSPIEPFVRYDFKEFSILGPSGGGTHRTMGLCLSYGLIKERTFMSHAYETRSADQSPLAELADVINALLKIEGKLSVNVDRVKGCQTLKIAREESAFKVKMGSSFYELVTSEEFLGAVDTLTSMPYIYDFHGWSWMIKDKNMATVAQCYPRVEITIEPLIAMAAEIESVGVKMHNAGWLKRFMLQRKHGRMVKQPIPEDVNAWCAEAGRYLAVNISR